MEIEDEFYNLYMGEFRQEIPQYIFDLAKEYHDITENFDRSVCTGPIIDGEIRPANGRELISINNHSKVVLRDVMSRSNGMSQKLHEIIRGYRFEDGRFCEKT